MAALLKMEHAKEAEQMIYHQPLTAIAHALCAINQQLEKLLNERIEN
jgi:hypothetical protein